jgi:hypothetical protein
MDILTLQKSFKVITLRHTRACLSVDVASTAEFRFPMYEGGLIRQWIATFFEHSVWKYEVELEWCLGSQTHQKL